MITCIALLATWLLAAPHPETLVRDLGAADFQTRQQASAALRQLGPAARAALESVEHSPDPEVRERARSLLLDLRLGIGADWPAELAELARRHAALPPAERPATLERLAKELGLRAVAFLQNRLAQGNPEEQQLARRHLQKFADQAVRELRVALQQRQPDTVRTLARQYRALDDFDARLLYLAAEVAEPAAAAALRQRALQLAPTEEAPHYQAAEMLGELQRDELARAEWNLILQIPPAADVYDINACLRLANIEAGLARYEAAADHLQQALTWFREARASGRGGYGMVGGSEQQIEARIRDWRHRAITQNPPPE